jgi:POT family proton-dependent oligopeptide transporter
MSELSESNATWFGHPRGLFVLFFAEMWERFSFYGMRGLLVFYLTKHFLFSDTMATGIYASYGALVYLAPVLGGLIADRYLGFRRAVILGAVLLCCGHLGMAFEGEPSRLVDGVAQVDTNALQILYVSLALIIVGVGFLKPSISSIVGELYSTDDSRRDGGFTLFYMGINVGAMLAALTCGYLGETYGWAYGFGLAGVGMLAGLITFVRGQHLLQGAGEAPDLNLLRSNNRFGLRRDWTIYLGAVLSVAVFWWLIQNQAVVSSLLGWTSAIVVCLVIGIAVQQERVDRDRLLLLLFLTAVSVVFWALFEQAGSSMNLFADRNVDRQLFGFTVAASQLQFFNPAFIILLAPLFSMLWVSLARRGWEPSTPAKFGLAILQVGLGFAALVYGAALVDSQGKVAMLWLMLAYFLHTTGELCLSPVGLSMVTRLAISKVVGLMMGVWFLSSSVAHYVAGFIASLASADPQAVAAGHTLSLYSDTFALVAKVAGVVGIVLLLLAPFIARFAHEAEADDTQTEK